jgi:uncharacterized protein (DUF1697 family)
LQKYIALLRGINVSGQKKVKMADLVQHCLAIDFQEVSTYIQSGNICFQHTNYNQQALSILLQDKIKQEYGFDVPVIVLSQEEFVQAFSQLPFNHIDIEKEGNQVLLSFLNAMPDEEDVNHLLTYVNAPEKLVVKQKRIYLHCPNGYGKSKLSNNFIESKLKVIATTRNFKTINKLISLLNK